MMMNEFEILQRGFQLLDTNLHFATLRKYADDVNDAIDQVGVESGSGYFCSSPHFILEKCYNFLLPFRELQFSLIGRYSLSHCNDIQKNMSFVAHKDNRWELNDDTSPSLIYALLYLSENQGELVSSYLNIHFDDSENFRTLEIKPGQILLLTSKLMHSSSLKNEPNCKLLIKSVFEKKNENGTISSFNKLSHDLERTNHEHFAERLGSFKVQPDISAKRFHLVATKKIICGQILHKSPIWTNSLRSVDFNGLGNCIAYIKHGCKHIEAIHEIQVGEKLSLSDIDRDELRKKNE